MVVDVETPVTVDVNEGAPEEVWLKGTDIEDVTEVELFEETVDVVGTVVEAGVEGAGTPATCTDVNHISWPCAGTTNKRTMLPIPTIILESDMGVLVFRSVERSDINTSHYESKRGIWVGWWLGCL